MTFRHHILSTGSHRMYVVSDQLWSPPALPPTGWVYTLSGLSHHLCSLSFWPKMASILDLIIRPFWSSDILGWERRVSDYRDMTVYMKKIHWHWFVNMAAGNVIPWTQYTHVSINRYIYISFPWPMFPDYNTRPGCSFGFFLSLFLLSRHYPGSDQLY